MLHRAILAFVLTCAASGGVILDRIAVVVGKRVIKTSDIDRDLRVTEFLNGQKPDSTIDAMRKSAERLIDQYVIRDEMEKGQYQRARAADVDGMLAQLLKQRFAGSEVRLKGELARYHLTEDQLRMQLQWQMDVLKFIDARFKPGVLVTEEEVRNYYNQHLTEIRREYPQLKTFEAAEAKVRALVEGERLNQNFEQWLAQARKRVRIEYRQGAFNDQGR
jgi:hypothetical protein